jgi:hypothetical protein
VQPLFVKFNVNIDDVRLADGEKAPLQAVKEAKGGSHTGATTGAILATAIVFFPAAPLFLSLPGSPISGAQKGADRSHIPDRCFGPYCVQICHLVHALHVAMVGVSIMRKTNPEGRAIRTFAEASIPGSRLTEGMKSRPPTAVVFDALSLFLSRSR